MAFLRGFVVGLSLLLLGSGTMDVGARLIRDTGGAIALLQAPTGAGTGFVIDVGGSRIMVSNAHVCALASGGLMLAQMDSGMYPVQVLAADTTRDLCLLQAPGAAPALRLAQEQHTTEPLYVYGHAWALARVLSRGYVAGMDHGWFYTSIPVYPGNSGSPVLDEAGEVVGVAVAADNRSHYGYIIPLETLHAMLKDAELVY